MIFRRATIADFDGYYNLKADFENIKWSGYTSEPDKERLFDWFKNALISSSRTIYVAEDNNQVCGYLYCDLLEEQNYEIGYGVHSSHTGKGIATYMISSVLTNIHRGGVSAWISIKNIGSRRAVEKCGFRETTQTRIHNLPLLPECQEFSLWIKEI